MDKLDSKKLKSLKVGEAVNLHDFMKTLDSTEGKWILRSTFALKTRDVYVFELVLFGHKILAVNICDTDGVLTLDDSEDLAW